MARRLVLVGMWSGDGPAEVMDGPIALEEMRVRIARFRACEMAERERWLHWPADDRPEPGRRGVVLVPHLRAWACDDAGVDPTELVLGRGCDVELCLEDEAAVGRAAEALFGLARDGARAA